jgi:hypothetical protein
MGVTDLKPKGSREKQYRHLRELSTKSEGLLVLSAATASPVLELVGAPTTVLHIAGPSGYGKSCLCRLAISLYGDPSGSLLRFDMSKDTANYVDARLGIVRHFPVLIDETTLLDSDAISKLAYNVALGADKGRLGGTEKGYTPTDPNHYRLVAFSSGEHSIRDQVEHRGATARIAEIVLNKPIFAAAECRRWYQRADQHHGWFGRDLIKSVITRYQGEKTNPWARLRKLYDRIHDNTAAWCHDHGRVIDFLAVLQLGYILMHRQLNMKFRALKKAELKTIRKKARKFARTIYGQLNLVVGVDRVLSEIRQVPNIDRWVKKGLVPLSILQTVAIRLGMVQRGRLTAMLKKHNISSGVQPRQIQFNKTAARISCRCILLTTEGMKRLWGGYNTTGSSGGGDYADYALRGVPHARRTQQNHKTQ